MFILGFEIKMILSQLLWAHVRCDVYCILSGPVDNLIVDYVVMRRVKFKVTIAYTLLHLTK